LLPCGNARCRESTWGYCCTTYSIISWIEGTTAGLKEQERYAISRGKISDHGPDTDRLLILHKFGHIEGSSEQERLKEVKAYQSRLHTDLNPRNMKLYVETYMKRNDILEELRNNFKCDILIIIGSNCNMTKQSSTMLKVLSQVDQSKVRGIKVDGAGDVLIESPEKVADAILSFCQVLRMVPTMVTPRDRRFTEQSQHRAMGEPDISSTRRLSLNTEYITL